MATKGQYLTNKVTGEKLQWLQTAKDTNGNLVQFESWFTPKAFMPVRHLHPRQTETFEVKSGVFKVECDGTIHYLKAGDTFTIEKGKPHQWWNESDTEEANVILTVEPAYNFEVMMEQIFGIYNKTGKLDFLQIMVMAKTYEMIIAGPPVFIQKMMWVILGIIGCLLGYKKFYPEYSAQDA